MTNIFSTLPSTIARLKSRRSLPAFPPFPAVAVVAALILSGLFAACADVSPSVGKYYLGRTLHLNVMEIDRTPELIYRLHSEQPGSAGHYRLAPSEENLELVMLRVKVENHTATSAIVSIDEKAAELRDFFHSKYFPINVIERAEEIDPPEDVADIRLARCPTVQPNEVCFLWNKTYIDGTSRSFDLLKGYGIEGWLIFEAPKDIEILQLRWRAGDGITIEF